jgi:signal transduction histidine kinase
MYRLLLVPALILCLCQSIHAQNKVPASHATSKTDSLSKRFDAAKDDAAKISVLTNAPQRIDEYYDKPAAIINLYTKALTLAQRIGAKKSSITLLMEIAYLEMNAVVDEPQAFKFYVQALNYAEEIKDYELCASICYSLGVISEHQNFKSEMFTYLFKSIEYTKKSSEIFLTPYQGLQIMFLEENRVNEALAVSKKCITYINERKSSVEDKLLAYGLVLEVLNKMPNKKQEADQYSKRVTSLLGEIKDNKSNHLSGRAIALVCYEAKQYDLAIYYASLPLKDLDTNRKTNTGAMLCYEVIANAYERLGQYQKSLENYKKYSKLYIKEDKNMVTLESGRRVIRAEGERNLLLKQREVEKEQFYRNLAFVIAAFILISGGVILFFYHRERNRKRELTQLNATKDKLFAILSHDLRSPVANLQSKVALTNWGGLSQQQFVQAAQQLATDIRYVSTTLDNLLHWALSQMGGLHPRPTSVPLARVVQEQIQLVQLKTSTKSIEVHTAIPPDVCLHADETHLAISIRNLLQNALKFTEPGGEVSISYARQQSQGLGQLTIRDTGIGMAPERLANLFRLDKQTTRAGTAQEPGTGLGLLLVKELVEANGGQIEVESEVGKGTTFRLTFDVVPARLPALRYFPIEL